jgi:hypothetical protein
MCKKKNYTKIKPNSQIVAYKIKTHKFHDFPCEIIGIFDTSSCKFYKISF